MIRGFIGFVGVLVVFAIVSNELSVAYRQYVNEVPPRFKRAVLEHLSEDESRRVLEDGVLTFDECPVLDIEDPSIR